MKKLMTLMLGCALAFGCVGTSFAQDNPPKKEKKAKGSKAPKKKKADKKS